MIVKWHWHFGDGSESNEQNPAHTYSMAGTYDVSLTVTDELGNSTTETKTAYITLTDAIITVNSQVLREADKIYRLAHLPEVGIGWCEYTGDYPTPEAEISALKVLDTLEQPRVLVLDAKLGKWVEIMLRNGPDGSDVIKYWQDKVDQTAIGTDVACTVSPREHMAPDEREFISHERTNVFMRPQDADNRGATGYDSDGFITGFVANIDLYKDGELTTPSATNKALHKAGDIFVDNEFDAKRIRAEVTTNKSGFRMTGIQHIFKDVDKEQDMSIRLMTENDYQKTLNDNLLFWFSRGRTPLLNRATGVVATPTVNRVAGVDGKSNSGLSFTSNFITAESYSPVGASLILWHKTLTSISIGGTAIALTSYNTHAGWTLSYATGITLSGILTIVPNVTGYVFDMRLLNGVTITTAELLYYFTNIVNRDGKEVLPGA